MMAVFTGVEFGPGVIALLFFLIFAVMYRKTRDPYLRLWQLAWAAYTVHAACLGLAGRLHNNEALLWGGDFALVVMGWCVFRSVRIVRRDWRLRRMDAHIFGAGAAWSLLDAMTRGTSLAEFVPIGHAYFQIFRIESGIAVLMAICAVQFYRKGRRRDSIGFRMLSVALMIWALALLVAAFGAPRVEAFDRIVHILTPIPELLLGIAMLIVLFETERRTVQENLLAFSTLDIDRRRLLTPREVQPGIERLIERLTRLSGIPRAAFCVHSSWKSVLPSVYRGIGTELRIVLEQGPPADLLTELAWHRGGVALYRDLFDTTLGAPEQGKHFELLRKALQASGMSGVLMLGVYSRERRFGTVLFPMVHRNEVSDGQIRLLAAAGTQIGLTLENHVVMQDAQRRTKEYELLTQIGQVISAHLDTESVMMALHRELGQLFDNSNFYIAFLEGDTVRFDLDIVGGVRQPKATRPATNGLTELIIRTGQPLLIRSDMDKTRERLGCIQTGRPSKCMAGVPIVMYGRPRGMMAVLHYDREFAYSERDIEVLKTAAGQVGVAMENARLFGEEQRRANYLEFLNVISKTAISSQNADQMLADIVAEVQKNFRFDHIGIGIVDYATKEIEIKAEAGRTAASLGRRVPIGAGVIGRVARSSELVQIHDTAHERVPGLLPDAKSVLCIPISYGETLLGILNIENQTPHNFEQQEVLILRTLADLLATALHNVFVFQKMEQQAITDGLTGIKTRRYFLEALQSEWKRASRSGRPFSVVLIDLDKFKDVNDGMGHLEGDLVLARVGRLLEQRCRQSNVVARYGGDEFVILMPETGLEQAQVLSERLRMWLATDPMMSERHVTGSFGVASFPLHGGAAEDIIRVADAGMYVSKHGGGNRVSTVEEFVELGSSHRQLVAAFIEGFLQREHVGPELADELVQILRKLVVAAKPEHAEEAVGEALLMLSRAAETREMHATGHGDAVARTAEIIARALELSAEDQKKLALAARAHDVGKILIPERILNKNSQLSDDEFYLVKMHAGLGAQVASTIPNGLAVQMMIRHHHERFDGTGYPDGLRGEEIPLGARIIAVADVFSNMTIDRPYGESISLEQACREMEKISGTQLDGMLVRTLLRELRDERTSKKAHA